MDLATLKLRLKRCKSPTTTTRTKYNEYPVRDKETAEKLKMNLIRCYRSFIMMIIYNLRTSGADKEDVD